MLEQLKFVKGAVSKKDYIPELTHFHIAGGRISGYNGKIGLSAPIALDVDCCPKAIPFVKAVEACTDTAQLHLTPAGKLAIRSGKFKAFIETLPATAFPEVGPQGQSVDIDGRLLPVMRKLYDLIGEDASRPWATGIMLNGTSAYATNNVILAEAWLGYHFPFKVVIPKYAVKEIVRIGEEPIGLQLTALSATFHYEGDRWMRTQLVSSDWPDIQSLLNTLDGSGYPVGEEFWQALETIAPFLDEQSRVFLNESTIGTAFEEGASVDNAADHLQGVYNHKMLSQLQGLASKFNFPAYPGRVGWYGEDVRGIIMGMRV